jgi:hypothetical protein
MKTSWAFVVVTAIMLALGAIPASASVAVTRTWVSATGSDGGTCPITAPCASFQYALSQTPAGGEIDCLTPGDFGGASGSVMINQAVSIICDGVSNGGIFSTDTSAGSAAVFITAPSDAVVYLSGLDLKGVGTQYGVVVASESTAAYIVHCIIRGFNYGVAVGTFATSRVVIKDSIIVNNVDAGLDVGARTGGTNAVATINTVVDGNGGIAANASGIYGGSSAIAVIQTLLTGSADGLNLQSGTSGELIGPSNTVSGYINGSTTSVPFK